MSSRRKGFVARLPHASRTQVCVMLRDGKTYAEIAAWCRERGHTDIEERHIERWAKPDADTNTSGYTDWLREQERLDMMQSQREFAMQLVRDNEGSAVHEASLTLAASQLYDVLTDFDPRELKDRLKDDPRFYVPLVDALAKLSKGGLEHQKYKDRVAEQRRRIEAELGRAKDKGGISAETMERIEHELKLL